MKIKYADIEGRYQSLINAGSLRLPRVCRTAIARTMASLETEMRIYQQQKEEILQQYAKKDDKGEAVTKVLDNGLIQYDIAPEHMQELSRDLTELNNVEINVSVHKFPSSALDICDESERYDIPTAAQEAALTWIMED